MSQDELNQYAVKVLRSVKLPEKRLAPGDEKTTVESSSFYFKCKGFDEAISETQEALNKKIKEIQGNE